jgi:hypothetical protein
MLTHGLGWKNRIPGSRIPPQSDPRPNPSGIGLNAHTDSKIPQNSTRRGCSESTRNHPNPTSDRIRQNPESPTQPGVDHAWFHRSKVQYDAPLSNFMFQVQHAPFQQGHGHGDDERESERHVLVLSRQWRAHLRRLPRPRLPGTAFRYFPQWQMTITIHHITY